MDKINSTYTYDIGGKKTVTLIIERIKAFVETHKSSQEIKVLDIGCGTCQLTNILANKISCHIMAIDVDEKSINMARKCMLHKNIELYVKDIEKEPVIGKFEIVLMTQIIDHLHDPSKLIKKIVKENLSDSGIVIIVISNGYGPYEISKKSHKFNMCYLKNTDVAKLKKMPFTCNNISPHLWSFNQIDLKHMVREAGLTLKKFENITFLLPSYPYNRMYYSSPVLISKLLDTLDSFIAFFIPNKFASNWYIECQKENTNE